MGICDILSFLLDTLTNSVWGGKGPFTCPEIWHLLPGDWWNSSSPSLNITSVICLPLAPSSVIAWHYWSIKKNWSWTVNTSSMLVALNQKAVALDQQPWLCPTIHLKLCAAVSCSYLVSAFAFQVAMESYWFDLVELLNKFGIRHNPILLLPFVFPCSMLEVWSHNPEVALKGQSLWNSSCSWNIFTPLTKNY